MKAIYRPKGKAAEYAEWACNFYTGCSNGCTYCYLKKGRGAKILGGDRPLLKKCFRDGKHAESVFAQEVNKHLDELRKHGLFFTFSSDPFLKETIDLTWRAANYAMMLGVNVKFLTKRADFVDDLIEFYEEVDGLFKDKRRVAFGFTLTGHDELEKGASTNRERIEAMKKLHDAGFKTFASIEPVIDFRSGLKMIQSALGYCDLYMVGLEAGKKYDSTQLDRFLFHLICIATENRLRVYLKDSLLKKQGAPRGYYEHFYKEFVPKGYNIFNH